MSGGGKSIVNETARISALRIQTSCYGSAIPVILGKQRTTGNLIYYGDLEAIKHKQSYGKGGGGVSSVYYTYRYSLQVGICEGPCTVGDVWMVSGDDKFKLNEDPQYGYTIYQGDTPNAYSTVLAGRHADQFFHYPGLCNFTAIDMGEFTGDTPPQFSFEVIGYDYDPVIGGADPAEAINTIITNQRWGASAPAGFFPVITNYGDYAVAMGWAIGLEMAAQKSAADWVQEILDQTNAAAVWSADHLEIIPYGDTAVSGNGRTWTPNVTPLYDLTDDDFLGDPEEPVRITRKADSETFNIQSVEFRNQANEYNTETTDGSDPASVAMYGPRKSRDTLSALGLLSAESATRLGDIKVQRQIRTRNEFEFELPWRYCRLLPMDIVTLTDAVLGLQRYPIRLTKVVETADMVVQCTAEDFPAGAGHAALIPRQPSDGYNQDYNTAPGNSAAPVIFEPPVALAGRPEIWLGTAGGANWGGANIWISFDNISYRNVGRTPGSARMGVTTSSLPLVADPDTASVLGINLSISQATVIGVSAADRDAFATLSWVGGELIAYKDATLTGVNAYNLSNFRRGLYGSPVTLHNSGVPFMRLDDAVFKYAYDPDLIGKTLYVKLQSVNLFGGAVQDIETLTPSTYVIQGAPMGKVSSLALSQPWDGPDCSVKWEALPSAQSYTMEVWAGSVKRRTVTGIASTGYTYAFADNKADGGPYRSIEFRLYGIAPNGSTTEPAVLAASNTQVAAPTGMSVNGSGPTLYILSNKPTAGDYAGTLFWASPTTGFNPLATPPTYVGPEWSTETAKLTPGRYYVRMAHFDIFGTDALNISSEIMVDFIGSVGGISEVADASTITTFPGDAFWAVYDQTTKKIWRWNAATSSYTKAADGGDLVAASVAADKIAVANLSAISANLGSITAAALDMFSGPGGGWGYARSYAKWLADGNNGWVLARNADGSSFVEFKVGSGRFWMSDAGGEGYGLQFPGVSITPSGATFSGTLSAATGTFAGAVMVGDFTGYAWPAAGGSGAYLGNVGFLFGNPNPSAGNPGGKYFQMDAPPGGVPTISTNIPAYIEDLQVQTMKLANNSVTAGTVGEWTNTGAFAAFYFSPTHNISLAFPAPVIIMVQMDYHVNTSDGAATTKIELYIDNVLTRTVPHASTVNGTVSMNHVVPMAAGTHAVKAKLYGSGSGTIADYGGFIALQGSMK